MSFADRRGVELGQSVADAKAAGLTGTPGLLEEPPSGEPSQDPVDRRQRAPHLESRAGRDFLRGARLARRRLEPRRPEDLEREPMDELVVEVVRADERCSEGGRERRGKEAGDGPGGLGGLHLADHATRRRAAPSRHQVGLPSDWRRGVGVARSSIIGPTRFLIPSEGAVTSSESRPSEPPTPVGPAASGASPTAPGSNLSRPTRMAVGLSRTSWFLMAAPSA